MRESVEGLPAQLVWAEDVDSVASPTGRAVLAGMGGSAMACDVASLAVEAAGGLAAVHRGYGLPSWAESGLLVAVSYSGNTEETLSSVEAAAERELDIAVVTSGGTLTELALTAGWPIVTVPPGLQPRAALGYLAGGVLKLLESAGLVGGQGPGLAEAAEVVSGILDRDGPAAAEKIADGLASRVAVIYGSTAPARLAARRWKTQINENGKAPAFWSELPEVDHNEIEGWSNSPDPVAVVFLREQAEADRMSRRTDLTMDLIGADIAVAGEVWSEGSGTLARFFSLAVIGDLTSVILAERAGIDPVPVNRIEEFKQRLAEG